MFDYDTLLMVCAIMLDLSKSQCLIFLADMQPQIRKLLNKKHFYIYFILILLYVAFFYSNDDFFFKWRLLQMLYLTFPYVHIYELKYFFNLEPQAMANLIRAKCLQQVYCCKALICE